MALFLSICSAHAHAADKEDPAKAARSSIADMISVLLQYGKWMLSRLRFH